MWIEIENDDDIQKVEVVVTPFTGVWIEILLALGQEPSTQSLPSRECGLKFDRRLSTGMSVKVTPFTGVWIEIRETFTI